MNRKIIHYKVLSRSFGDDISKEVTTYLNDGWELYGFPFEKGGYFAQVVVKYDKLEKI